jgi:hypothetical protein
MFQRGWKGSNGVEVTQNSIISRSVDDSMGGNPCEELASKGCTEQNQRRINVEVGFFDTRPALKGFLKALLGACGMETSAMITSSVMGAHEI